MWVSDPRDATGWIKRWGTTEQHLARYLGDQGIQLAGRGASFILQLDDMCHSYPLNPGRSGYIGGCKQPNAKFRDIAYSSG